MEMSSVAPRPGDTFPPRGIAIVGVGKPIFVRELQSSGISLIRRERDRQIEDEGHTAANDDKQVNGELAIAAACYAVHGYDTKNERFEVNRVVSSGFNEGACEDAWPWDPEWDKREEHPPLRRLVIAGALIAAEIDRLLRAGVTK